MSPEAFFLVLAPTTPFALALLSCLPGFGRRLLPILPWAPFPALAIALFGASGIEAPLPSLLLHVRLILDEPGRVFLLVTALLWSLAGAYAWAYLREPRAAAFSRWWLVTLTGNLLILVAGDVVSFYAGFSLMSLAAFGLIIHERTAEAVRAARIYLILAVFGETCLLLGIMVAATAADSLSIAAVRDGLSHGPNRDLAIGLLIVGFGLKAGLMPLHAWLPLAHPAAPTPASAVLSGAMVKAGIFGLVRFLPLGETLVGWGALLAIAGLTTAYLAVAFGLFQTRPKTILAYSTVSQMGLLIGVIGAGAASTDPGRLIEPVALYVAHHGLAKSALFLGVGVVAACTPRMFRPAAAVLALMATAVAGMPLTGGALAKLVVKEPVGEGLSSLLLTLSALGTTLLMLRFLQTTLRNQPDPAAKPRAGLAAPFFLTALAAFVVPWWLYAGLEQGSIVYPLAPAILWAGAWPVLAGVALALACRTLPWRPRQSIPEGDIVVLAESAARAGRRALPGFERRWTGLAATFRIKPLELHEPTWPDRLERALGGWRVAACVLAGGLLVTWVVLAARAAA